MKVGSCQRRDAKKRKKIFQKKKTKKMRKYKKALPKREVRKSHGN